MNNDYKANPIDASLVSRPGESKEFLGTRNVKELLPSILRTHLNNKFFDSTVEQLMSSGSLSAINHYIGRSDELKKSSESYIDDINFQFVPSIVNRDNDNNITDVLTYDDLIKSLEFNGVDTNNHNSLFNETGYTLGLPINYDMFINHHKYFWMLNNLPVNDIIPVSSNPIDIDDIVGSINYTTATLDNGKTLTFGNGMRIRFSQVDIQTYTGDGINDTFSIGVSSPSEVKVYSDNLLVADGVDYNIVGSNVVFVTPPASGIVVEVHSSWVSSTSGDYKTGAVYIVDNVGQPEGIVLIEQYAESNNPYVPTVGQTLGQQVWINQTIYSGLVGTPFESLTGFDTEPFDQRFRDITDRDYLVETRITNDKSAWSRSNLWVKEDVISDVCEYNDLDIKDYANDLYRAVRPIIEFQENIEKYDFGQNHIENVTHILEGLDPATDIIGQPFNYTDFITTTVWTTQGYDAGDKVRYELGGDTTYWECIESHATAKDPTFVENNRYWVSISTRNITDGDTILFIRTGNSTYDNNIFSVTTNAAQEVTALTEIRGSSSTPLQQYDKVLVLIGHNAVFNEDYLRDYPGAIWSGSEWYWNGSDWVYGQQKDHKGQNILFELYDKDKNHLEDTVLYPKSTFQGDPMFRYGVSETASYDYALGIRARRVDYGNNPGFDFDIGCGNIRYEYRLVNVDSNNADLNSDTVYPITGYYYYKKTDTGIYFNNWHEINQPVKRAYQNIFNEPATSYNIDLGTTDINVDDKFDVLKRGDGIDFYSSSTTNTNTDLKRLDGLNPLLYLKRNKTYTFKTHFDETEIEFTDTKGNVLAGITRSVAVDNLFTVVIDSTVTDDIIKYTKTSGTPASGYIYLYDDSKEYTIDVVIRNSDGKTVIDESSMSFSGNIMTITHNFSIDDVLEVYWYSDGIYSSEADGEFLPAETNILNPQNEKLPTASFGDLQTHIRSQMESIPGFTGYYFGDNNYVSIPFNNIFGGTIRQQAFSTELLAQTSSSVETNPYSSIKYVNQNYRKFRSQFRTKVQQLHNSLDMSIPVYELVDTALKQMNLGKNRNSPFSQSDMAYYTDFESVDVRWHNGDSQVFDLPKTVNEFNDTFNHVQVWVKDVDANGVNRWRVLTKDVDYTLTAYNVTITTAITYDADDDAYAHIRWYPQNSVSYIPPSAAKLGLVRPYRPELLTDLYVDFDYIEDQNDYIGLNLGYGDYTNAILLHDGGIHVRSGTELFDRSSSDFNIIDAAIWELENRIVNNLNEELDTIVDYKEIMPNVNRPSRITWDKLNEALNPEFTKWKIKNNIDSLNDDTWYNAADPFTWNYSSVGPGIGGFKGLYVYYFNTDAPHIRPWEMFGYNKRPNWWDANYAWDDVGKRAALIEALKVGHYNNPADTPKYNITYAYTNYDWDTNTLVTATNELNDPVTANVVSAPTSVEASKDFVFGDWGPIEINWRLSSDYRYSLFVALMKLRPLWVTNTFFNSINRSVIDGQDYQSIQYYFEDSGELGNNREVNLTYTGYDGNTIDYIDVVDGGTGYPSTPTLTVYSNFGTDADVLAYIESGTVVAASVIKSGEGYQTKPIIIPSDEGETTTASFRAYLTENKVRYYTGLSNSIVEYSRYNNITIDDLQTRFSNSRYDPVIKMTGFANKNNQEFILESSQDKGKFRIPSENVNMLLYKSQPKNEVFFGSVKITKTEEGYRVTGFDNSNQIFTYYPVNKNSGKITVDVNNYSVTRYTKFYDFTDTVAYNTVFENVQDAYDFINGYQHYLEESGWSVTTWIKTANDFASWAFDSNTSVGDTIFVKPDTTRIYIREPENGYFDIISSRYDGNYNIIDENGRQISLNKFLISRNIDTGDETNYTLVERKDNETVIHGLRLYTVDLQHVAVFDSNTIFDDVIYNPALGQFHKRIIWRGSRTKGWNGKLYSPGYIVNGDTIINNFDTTARELDQYYGVGQTLNNQQMLDVARFNAGYNKPTWAEDLLLDDDTAWNLTKGSYKYKGTHELLNAISRSTSLFGSVSNLTFDEDWAIRTADYGDTRTNDVLEFQLKKSLITSNPQSIRFTDGERNDNLNDIVIDVDSNSDLLITGTPGNNFQTRPHQEYNLNVASLQTFENVELFKNDFINAGFPLLTETDYRVLNTEHFVEFPDTIDGTYSFSTDWQDIEHWDNQTSYVYGDRVIYEGKVWEMVNQEATGLFRPNDPIQIYGTVSSPFLEIIESGDPEWTVILGQTSADAQTVTISSTVDKTTYETIVITGTVADPEVIDGSTLEISAEEDTPQIITFNSTLISTAYPDVSKTGSVTNPTIDGGTGEILTIDGSDITFTQVNNIDETTNNSIGGGIEWFISGGTVSLSFDGGGQEIWIDATSANIDVNDWDPVATTIRKFRLTFDATTTAYSNVGTPIAVTGLSSSFKTVTIEAAEWPTQLDFDGDTNRTDIFSYTTQVKEAFVGTTPYVYDLADIISQIQGVLDPVIYTISNVSNRLKITKTTTTPELEFSLTINAATGNDNVGFQPATETITSVGVPVTSNPNLSLSEIITIINNSGVPGIEATASTDNRLQIVSRRKSVKIGSSGTANTELGLTAGRVYANEIVTTVLINGGVTNIVNAINDAGISGITASNSSGRVRITSTNSTLYIGTGTANSRIGLTSGTTTATQSTISNVFNAIDAGDGETIFLELEDDPHTFSIWVAQDEENRGYNVYQAMDFGFYIFKACAGITEVDDAEIILPDGINHNLEEGDYVLIRGSNTTPSIDGIHKVTSVSSSDGNKFYIDEFIEENGNVGNIYPMKSVRFPTYTDLLNEYNSQNVYGVYKYNFQGKRQGLTENWILAYVDDNGSGVPAVYRFVGTFDSSTGHDGYWSLNRNGEEQSRNDLIENVSVFESDKQTIIDTYEIFDPIKGIIPGFLDSEIDFKNTNDLAVYNYDTLNGYADNNNDIIWQEDFIGKRWWDLKTAVYVNYEQGPLDYRQNNWGRLFDGASIDIYEWSKSPVLPEQWGEFVESGGAVDGVPASGEAFYTLFEDEKIYKWVESSYYNKKNKRTETVYYFWVKNKDTRPYDKFYNTIQLSNILNDPTAFDVKWAAASGAEQLIIANARSNVTEKSVAQINQRYEGNSLTNSEYTMLSQNGKDIIPEYLHIKMRDSLVGYNQYTERYVYTTYSAIVTYSNDQVVVDGSGDYYISLADSNTGNTPSLDTTESYWKKITDYSLPIDTPIDDIDILKPKLIPDVRLHPLNRYGHLERPVQSLIRNIKEARQNIIATMNDLLSRKVFVNEITNIDDILNETFVEGEITYDLGKYWTYNDYVRREYIDDVLVYEYDTDNIPAYYEDTLISLETSTSYDENDLVYVRNIIHRDGVNRPAIVRLIDGEWITEWKKQGTISLSEELWNQEKYGHGFDVSPFDITAYDSQTDNILKRMLDIFREDIFINTNRNMYSEMWFSWLNFAITENTASDFVFKTTYGSLRVEHPVLTNETTYQKYSTIPLEQFIIENKPFHTKIRQVVDSPTYKENGSVEISESYSINII